MTWWPQWARHPYEVGRWRRFVCRWFHRKRISSGPYRFCGTCRIAWRYPL